MSASKLLKSSPVKPSPRPSAKRLPGRRALKTAPSFARLGTRSTRAAESADLPVLQSVRPRGLYKIEAVWRGGRKCDVDLAPHILRFIAYGPLRENWSAFKQLQILDGGVAVGWPELDLDISADAIAALARQQNMTANDFRSYLKRLGLSFDAAAAAFEISRRQIAYYSAGAKPVPRHVVLALRGFEAELAV